MLQLCISNCYAIFFIVLTFINNILCFNIEELKAINYEVDILQTPMKKEEPSIPVVHMTSIFGQEYQCILPHIEEEEVAEKITYSEKNADIKELLKPLHTGNCLLKAKDWWTYELCFGQYIKQFHIEDGQIIGQIITLGFYDSDYDWNNETDQEKFKHLKQRYHSQFYVNGTKCDLTGQPRVAEVKIYCEEDAGDYIYRVDEPGTCSYVIAVHTSRVCSHPQLKPLPSKKAHTIPCHPLLNERQFAKYQAKLNEETAVANEKRNQWLTNQQERLQVMKKDNPQTDKDDISAFNEFYKNVIKEIEADPELNYLSGIVKKDGGENSDSASKPEGSDSNTKKSAENYLFKEYDKELEKLKSFLTPENFAAVKNMLQERFQALLNEANENDKAEKKDDKNTANKLTSMLNSLLKMLHQAEKDVIEATKRISKTRSSTTTSTTEEASNIAKKAEISELELGRKKSKVNDDKKKALGNEEKKKNLDDADSDDELQVLIRRLDKVRSSTRGYEIDQLQQKKLEKAIKENLEKSGINTGGRRIEVKIIKAGYYDNHLTDEEANQFQNMITALLTGEQETIQEIERNKKLEENYKFTWKTEPDEESDEN